MLRNTQQVMLRIHFLQQWFGLSDVAMEEALFDVPLYRQFAGLGGMNRLPDRVSILRFRHLQVVDRYRSPPRKQALPGGGGVSNSGALGLAPWLPNLAHLAKSGS